MRIECKVDVKLCAELIDAGKIMKMSLSLNKDSILDWSIPLNKFQTDKVLTIQEVF
jgi:hypothetical protein